MTEIIFKEEGTLDKYIGDAIMAIFNAPLELKDHPGRACTVALNMTGKMPQLNSIWRKRGFPNLSIGVGINTGEAVVGNMGAELRFDYTAIGDAVNLASRLEGMNKLYGTSVIASESTYTECRGGFVFRELDFVRVKGKEKPAAVYELMAPSGAKDMEELASLFGSSLLDYRKGKFETAKKGFEEAFSKFPDDGPSHLYIQRCERFIESPPAGDWDGIYISEVK
jgi:adenylate cyclase